MAASKTSERLVGTVVPVGALRTKESAGVGEFLDLIPFAGFCASAGLGLIQLLPVNDTGYESSPYSALTAFALHPLYLRIQELPEAASFSRQIARMRDQFKGELRFPYEKILRAKMALLREIYEANKAEIAASARPGQPLSLWINENPWVIEYAVYRRLKELNGEKSWTEWKEFRDAGEKDIAALWENESLRGEHLFWVWIQQNLDSQFRKAAEAAAKLGIILKGDLPILMNEDSADVWAHGEFFQLDLSAGAPPDMYSPEGQNWGFPIYNWQTQSKDDYSWWRKRLKAAERYYGAYRIDHVLGFFRIWASSRNDFSASLGRYISYIPINNNDFEDLKFDPDRVRWLSRPHVPTAEVWDVLEAVRREGGDAAASLEAERVFREVLDRIGNEELWLFKDSIRGEKDIAVLEFHPALQDYLFRAWRNRFFLEYEKGSYFPVWYGKEGRAYQSLSGEERERLEKLLAFRKEHSEHIWEDQGRRLLQILIAGSSMLACAEDLGAVPACVPKVLAELKILGLRVFRWNRKWDEEGEPYVPFDEYPELSVAAPAVHDSSTVREWWEREADQGQLCDFLGEPSLPRLYNPGLARKLLGKAASAASRFRIFQIQDLLHLSPKWYADDPASERINVPGTHNGFNWTYRLPADIEEIGEDTHLLSALRELSRIGPEGSSKI